MDQKLEDRVGFGVFVPELDIRASQRIPDHCSVFQSEVTAIRYTADLLSELKVSSRDILIFSDSQAAIHALGSRYKKSKTVMSCSPSLNGIATETGCN